MVIASAVAVRFQPSTSDSTTAGAEMTAPTDKPRDNRKSRLVKLRVFASNRCSRYSVRGVDARVVEERHERHRQDDHRERQREVELDEAHPVAVRLAGRADHRDGAQLRGHDRDAGGPPGNAALREEVALDLVAVLGALQAVVHDPGREEDDNDPVDGVHQDCGGSAARETLAGGTRVRRGRRPGESGP